MGMFGRPGCLRRAVTWEEQVVILREAMSSSREVRRAS
jgi:hypothetical protein